MFELDEDTAVEEVAPGRWMGRVTDRWDIGPIPNGGYVLAVAMSALRRAMPGLDPLTVTAHYLRPAAHGPAEIAVEVVKRGRSVSTAAARMAQAGKEHLLVLATYGDLGVARTGAPPAFVDGAPPEVPPAEAPQAWSGSVEPPAIAKRFDLRFAPETVPWLAGERGDRAEIRARVRLADGRPPDVHALALFADALPPPVFNVMAPGWVPTIELTVHVRARPAPGWLLCRFRTRYAFGGYLEEDGEIWDEEGTLVALSRQLATVPRGGF